MDWLSRTVRVTVTYTIRDQQMNNR